MLTKLDQMSRVGSRGRHPKCRPKSLFLIFFSSLKVVKVLNYFLFDLP